MKRLILLLPLLSVLVSACAVTDSPSPSEGWIDLHQGGIEAWVGGTTFDPAALAELDEPERGERIAGWTATVAEHWHVDGDELVSDGHGPHLVTPVDYGDFELELEWKIMPGGDSGLYLRGYPQVQIWDPWNEREHKNGSDKGSGGLWNNDVHERWPAVRADHRPGEWNHMRVTMRGSEVWVELNGHAIVEAVELDNYFRRGEPLLERGPVHLQTHGSEVRFRGVRIRPLD